MIPKIAFLFLTVGNIYHENIWVKFFENNESQYSLYVHPKNELTPDSFFSPAAIQKRAKTRWENTMKAQILLLEEALKDPANTKFVFLSESTIPLTHFQEVYNHLLAHPHSEFSFTKNSQTVTASRHFGKIRKVYKNSQWIVLNRKHAQLMVDDEELINEITRYSFDNEHYPSTFLAQHKLLDEVIQNHTTLAIWAEGGAHPHTFKDIEHDPFKKVLMKAIRKKVLFARKFSPTCDLKPLAHSIPLYKSLRGS